MKSGQSFTHYTVSSKIGAGGMGEVFRATDGKLSRDVALKVLPDSFAADPERLARFQREAQVLASLNHPGIAAIYGLESEGEIHALAMELVEGPDLSERLKTGPMPVDEAIRAAIQIAEAMDAAHEKGVVHRDLKPANIKIDPNGRVKILDFGLAKALVDSPAESDIDPAMSPTLTAAMTMQGVILGTAAYMSPEQARGKEADRRADIWSFGAVFYEMLTGHRLFAGETVSDTLAAVLRKDPDWSALPQGLDPSVNLVLRKCLERFQEERLQNMGDVRILLGEKLAGASTGGGERFRTAAIALGAMLVISIGLNFLNLRDQEGTGGPADEAEVQHLAVSLAPRAPLARARVHPLGIARPTLSISPDGTHLVYTAEVNGDTKLFKKRFDAAQADEIPGTEGAYHPAFSPDGDWVAFMAGDRLRKVLYAGSEPVTLCEARNTFTLTWESDNSILLLETEGRVLARIDTDSGSKTVVNPEASKGAVSVLPGGTHLLGHSAYQTGINPDSWVVGALDLDDGNWNPIIDGGFSARYVPTGHLVYVRGGNLMGVVFDPEKIETRGRPVPVVAGLRVARRSLPSFDFSDNGTLVYVSGPPQTLSNLVWVDRKGAISELPLPAQFFGDFQISPDGRFVAATVGGDRNDVWIYDLNGGPRRKLTTEGDGAYPIWNPEGDRVAFRSSRSGEWLCYTKPVDGSRPATPLPEAINKGNPYVWTSRNELFLYSNGEIVAVDLDDETVTDVAVSAASEWGPHMSPDEKWIAYTSDESGRYEIYVKAYPGSGGAWVISAEGGEEPIWSRDGRSLFYRNGDTWLEAPVSFEPEFTVGTPRVVIEGPYINVPGRSYDVSADGSKFLVILDEGNEEYSRHVEVILNWFDELERLVPTE